MQVTVQVSDELVRAITRQQLPDAHADNVFNLLKTTGLVLEPMHRNTDDRELSSFYTIEVTDQATAQNITDRLLKLDGIKAAYIKPADAQP